MDHVVGARDHDRAVRLVGLRQVVVLDVGRDHGMNRLVEFRAEVSSDEPSAPVTRILIGCRGSFGVSDDRGVRRVEVLDDVVIGERPDRSM